MLSASATTSIASSRRSARSVRHSFASSTAARRSGLRCSLELVLEPLEQRDAVGGRAGEPADRAALAEPADLARAALHDRVAERDLAVAGDDDLRRRGGPTRIVVEWISGFTSHASQHALVVRLERLWQSLGARGWASS